MASRPSIECPICNDELNPSEQVVDHLVEAHSKEELAKSIAAEWEARGEDPTAE